MARVKEDRAIRERFTLRQAVVVAILLHVIFGVTMQWRPDLLWSEPVVPPPEQQPLEFRFIDTPETEPPEEVAEDASLSDIDRAAADTSPRDDAADPFSEGNTPQEVFREPPPSVAAPEQPAVAPGVPVESPEATPAPEPQPEAEENVAETGEADTTQPEEPEGDVRMVEEAARPEEEAVATAPPLETGPPVALPPRQPNLRSSLSRLDSYTQPEVMDNPDGGVGWNDGIVSFDTKGYPLGAYIKQILSIIERNWKSNIPPAAYLPGMKGATFVQLSIERGRSAAGVEIAQIVVYQTWSSGKPAFDQAALFALEISSPLPPIPPFFPYEKLDGRLGFLYNLDPSQVTFPSGQQD
jgi:outer membrane biosynthesis protein TonB